MSVVLDCDSLRVQQLWPLELFLTDYRAHMLALLADN